MPGLPLAPTSTRLVARYVSGRLKLSTANQFAHHLRLDGLALTGNAPRIFTKTSKNGLPYVSVFFCAAFCALAYMSVSSGGGKVFGWFANLTSICGLITWTGICFTYLRFHAGMKAQGFDRKTLPFASRFQPYAAYFGFFATIIICFVSPCMQGIYSFPRGTLTPS